MAKKKYAILHLEGEGIVRVRRTEGKAQGLPTAWRPSRGCSCIVAWTRRRTSSSRSDPLPNGGHRITCVRNGFYLDIGRSTFDVALRMFRSKALITDDESRSESEKAKANDREVYILGSRSCQDEGKGGRSFVLPFCSTFPTIHRE